MLIATHPPQPTDPELHFQRTSLVSQSKQGKTRIDWTGQSTEGFAVCDCCADRVVVGTCVAINFDQDTEKRKTQTHIVAGTRRHAVICVTFWICHACCLLTAHVHPERHSSTILGVSRFLACEFPTWPLISTKREESASPKHRPYRVRVVFSRLQISQLNSFTVSCPRC